ncbi:MAG: diguanylate cyclase [Sterolibacteriaceae bacterium MAG5]|nr:diguanylate cyclase [Candidatus Nitricoxidireducens bremensis]
MNTIDLAKFEQLKASGDLPSPKGVALAIIRLTQRDDTSLADLAHVVKSDPAFVGRLIKTANSVHAGGRRPIASIQDALIVLGVPAVRSLALGFSLLSGFRSGSCRNFDYQRYWSRSLVFAVALQALAARTHAAPPDEAFSVGLLTHIGELALATIFPEDYSGMLGKLKEGPATDLLELERQTFVMTHNELTAAMLMDWGLPKVFTEPVFHHEQPDGTEMPEGSRQYAMLWSLVLADRIADICLAADDERRALMPELIRLGSRLLIDADALNTLCDKVARDWQEWGALLDVETALIPPFEEMTKAPPPPQIGADDAVVGLDSPYRMRVLVVDDDPSMRAILRALLVGAGHEVFEAINGQQGFEMALDVRPQIMIVDWMMPELDGIALTRSLRQTKLGRNVYVLILTGIEDDNKLVEAFEAGVDDYMTKPLKPRVLAARLRAGQRVVKLQQEIERDREEIRHFAAELAVTNRRLQEAALTDSLTGIPNRRHAIERIQQEWAAASRSKRPLACMVVDVDEFKKINDNFGHDVGDAVLREGAKALKGALRAQDLLCRVGGDEFLVICPDTDLPAALVCAERMRKAMESMQIETGAERYRGSISVGVAVRDDSMVDADALIKVADQGVYVAKQTGRNRLAALQSPSKRE